jgi:DNA (cytosine-5)-methyltransferase 1
MLSAEDSLAKTSQVQGGGAGIEQGTRSGLWYQMARIISEIRPRFVFIENSPLLRKRGLNKVLRSIAEMGYNARWGVLGARHYGGPVARERIWIACSNKINGEKGMGFGSEKKIFNRLREQCPYFWLQAPSKCFGMEHGMDSYMDQVSAIGNGQVPLVAASAFRILSA